MTGKPNFQYCAIAIRSAFVVGVVVIAGVCVYRCKTNSQKRIHTERKEKQSKVTRERRKKITQRFSENNSFVPFSELDPAELLFFGITPVYLSLTDGEVVGCPMQWLNISEEQKEKLQDRAISRLKPLASLGKRYEKAVVPAIPRFDPIPGSKSHPWPIKLGMKPLLKVPESCKSITGVASGIRSALVKVDNEWYRFKGCGNYDQGFPVEIKGDNGELNVRGSCFEHTSLCELEMTEKLNAIFQNTSNISCANQSVGYYKYTSSPDWPLPKIKRFCPIFKTAGNRRLGDHLLSGLAELIPFICPLDTQLFNYLEAAISCKRTGETVDGDISRLIDTSDLVACEMQVADVSDFTLFETQPPSFTEMKLKGYDLSEYFREIWNENHTLLNQCLDEMKKKNKVGSVLLLMAWQLGWECGVTLKILHEAHISWGTFPDEMGVHCNAHANNFVVRAPSENTSSDQPFLSPLDFDMSFSAKDFIPECVFRSGKLSGTGFKELLAIEQNCLAQVLAGSDFASTGVSNKRKETPTHRVINVAFCDTLVSGFKAGYSGLENNKPVITGEIRELANSFIKLALVMTAQDVG